MRLSPGGGRGAPPFRNGTTPKILLIDDSPSARTILHGQLVRLGIPLPNLRAAASVEEALQWFTQWDPDIVFVDLQLRAGPGTPPNGGSRLPANGAELAAHFMARNPQLGVVICSAMEPEDAQLKEHAKSGRVFVIVKPVLAAKVQAVLEKFMTLPPGRTAASMHRGERTMAPGGL